MALKHIGRMKNNQRKVIVAYRTIPGDAEHAIVVTTENLAADEHDSLMKLVESNAGQTAYELAEAMARSVLPDGRNMLAAFHATGKMIKVPTNTVEMTPDTRTTIVLSELNLMIAQQKGVSIDDLALKGTNKKVETIGTVNEVPTKTETVVEAIQAPVDGVLTDEQIAAQYRSQADALYKEAKRLRDQAEELAPTKKKTVKTSESA
jgi:hypothetical protein